MTSLRVKRAFRNWRNLSADDFWNDRERAQKFSEESARLHRQMESSKKMNRLADLQDGGLGLEEDEETQALLLEELTADTEQFYLTRCSRTGGHAQKPQDKCNCILILRVLAAQKVVTGRMCSCACANAGANAAVGR